MCAIALHGADFRAILSPSPLAVVRIFKRRKDLAMTLTTVSYHAWRYVALAAILLTPPSAYPQIALTGAAQFSTDQLGAATATSWDTLPVHARQGEADCCYGLWLSLNPDATSPVNGPSNAQTPIDITLELGKTYKYYTFGYPYQSFSVDGLNLFFDGNNDTPGISVFGALNSSAFLPNSNSNTETLQAYLTPGSGRSFYSAADGVTVVLAGFELNAPATPPGDVCQGYTFAPAPGNVLSYFGSFTLQVWPAASLSINPTSGTPFTEVNLTGSGFAPAETVEIYGGHIGAPPRFTLTTTDASGSFAVTAREPQHPYGPMDVYAVGVSSHKLGAAALFVTPALLMDPGTGAPGGTIAAYGFGFGAGELVDVYWNNPRQLLGTATADVQGSSKLAISIPANASPGINGLIGVGQTTQAIGIGSVAVQ